MYIRESDFERWLTLPTYIKSYPLPIINVFVSDYPRIASSFIYIRFLKYFLTEPQDSAAYEARKEAFDACFALAKKKTGPLTPPGLAHLFVQGGARKTPDLKLE